MSHLAVFDDNKPSQPLSSTEEPKQIQRMLAEVGVRFEQWPTSPDIRAGDSQEAVIAAYKAQINDLCTTEGYQTVDVISLGSDHPDKFALRDKFLSEHHHSEDEVRFFVRGQGLFALHIGSRVYEVTCEQGDLLSVPANTRHWFDLGPNPDLVAIRFFNNPDGWVAHYSGSDIAASYSRLEN